MQSLSEDSSPVMQTAVLDRAAAPQADQQPAKVALQETPARRADACARHLLRRVDYTQNRHRYWRYCSAVVYFCKRAQRVDYDRSGAQDRAGKRPRRRTLVK